MIARLVVVLLIQLGLLLGSDLPSFAAENAVLPIRLDYPLLRSFFVQQIFNGPGEVAVVANENNGCQLIELSQPEVRPSKGHLSLKARIKLRSGLPLMGECRMPVEWEGFIEASQKVYLDMPGWTLRFRTRDLRFSNLKGEPYKLTEVLWNLVKNRLEGHLDQLTVNLLPSVQEIQTVLPQFFRADDQARITTWLQTLRAGDVVMLPETCLVEILMTTDREKPPPVEARTEEALSPEELAGFLRTWEDWDAFLVFQIRQLGQLGLTEEERAAVLRILLETRHQLIAALAAERLSGTSDLVRTQFVQTWERLAPLFRRHLNGKNSADPTALLVYLSATDALTALDRIGPELGLEVSHDGLLRLARLLATEGTPVELAYSFEPDAELRRIFGWAAGPEVTGPVFSGQELDWVEPDPVEADPFAPGPLEPDGATPDPGGPDHPGPGESEPPAETMLQTLFRWICRGVPSAFAAEIPASELQALLKVWIVDRINFDSYVARVRDILREEADRIMASGKIAPERRGLLEKLMHATVWQESCFRQFLIDKGKLTYLRSWNNTSVGMMQINERVWRGFYKVDALRWDPRYNIKAGSEIIQEYLSRYILKPTGSVSRLDEDGMARAAYAIYNSGPAGLDDFMQRHGKKAYSQTDKLFWDKYLLTKSGSFEKLGGCLFGN